MGDCRLDPADEYFAPLLVALGRAVLAAASLEKVLLLEIAQQRVAKDGLANSLGGELAELEGRSAGKLLGALAELGIPAELASRIRDVIERRNRLVHHLMEDVDAVRILETPTTENVARVVARIDEVATDCGELIAELAPGAFGSLEAALGATMPELHQAIKALDLEQVPDARLRGQLAAIASVDTALLPPGFIVSTGGLEQRDSHPGEP